MPLGRIIIGILFLVDLYFIFFGSYTDTRFVLLIIAAVILGVMWLASGKPGRKLQHAH